ncbi:anti-sigma factor family protein [Aureimonas leprariae]|uniref:Anti-sigma factor n=1 Tax=Plantimonas leprariae TaxID=2615207 RepID=A0A7V7PT31_9HYPH|nr:anti-sigma factor [Aureimonas leprariae]KAB0682776.1 anti-sigma factor [Aureimonas leprariae]
MRPDEEDHLLLAAYLDGELSAGETIEMERRLAADPDLRQLFERLQALSGSVRRTLAETPVPAGLEARLAERFGKVEVLSPPSRRRGTPPWLAAAACLLLGLAGGGAIGYAMSDAWRAGGGGSRTLDAVYAGHIRALAAPAPFDIASSERHVVKPWFNGRTVVAPDVPDFGAEGFPLAGGRVDVVGGEKVPTLVYRRRQHVISVTVVPRREGEGAADPAPREGSRILRWDAGDLTYFAVSDLNGAELRQFADLFRSRLAPAG